MADVIHVSPLQQAGILYLYSQKDELDMEPPYQRMGDIWPISKRRLLIDSIINGYDIPKIYVHEYNKPERKDGNLYRWAVVDGKQRLNAIFQFIENSFSLDADFVYMKDPGVDVRGLTYTELAKKHPKIKMAFDAYTLPVYSIRTSDIDLIEDMFSRLNEAAPLNAAEKRNAFGGPLPKIIREISSHAFFNRKVSFDNKRYRHYDVIAKLLLLTSSGWVVDTKKIHLDKFVKSFSYRDEDRARLLQEEVTYILDELCNVFVDKDALLRSMSIIPIYYWVMHAICSVQRCDALERKNIEKFEENRKTNRALAQDEEVEERVHFPYLEFDRLSQTPNDSYAIRFRIEVLCKAVLDAELADEVIAKLEKDVLEGLFD